MVLVEPALVPLADEPLDDVEGFDALVIGRVVEELGREELVVGREAAGRVAAGAGAPAAGTSVSCGCAAVSEPARLMSRFSAVSVASAESERLSPREQATTAVN